jgi:carbon starvation protein
VFLALLIIIAIFGLVIAVVFKLYPESVIAVWLEIPIAIVLGWAVYKKSANVTLATIVAVGAMYAGVVLGAWLEHNPSTTGLFTIPDMDWMPATGTWTILLLIYAWIASTLPVTFLLQPRDYINAWQLFIMMALLMAGVGASALFAENFTLTAPAFNTVSANTPPMLPMMFVTIACGAISGFHSLVAGGTSPKQISAEPDAKFIGYGSMLTEGMLAVLVIICICAGLGMAYEGRSGPGIWQQFYSSWRGGLALGGKLEPVVVGAANMMQSIGIPQGLGFAIMGVFISSFAGTTLDTAVRIQRYVVGELAEDLRFKPLTNRFTATSIAVITAAGLAFATGANGTGAMTLWPMFGTVNQLLAALALLVVTMYLHKQGGLKWLVAGIPCVIMLIITSWAMLYNERSFYRNAVAGDDPVKWWLLTILGAVVLALAVWMTIETIIVFFGPKESGNDR